MKCMIYFLILYLNPSPSHYQPAIITIVNIQLCIIHTSYIQVINLYQTALAVEISSNKT